MSATLGIHDSTPSPVDPTFDGLKLVMAADYVPTGKTRITHKGAKGNVEASPICIGAWPWGDKATFSYRPEERPYLDQVWDICFQNGINFIDTAQGYGGGLS